GGDSDEVARNLADPLLHPALTPLPGLAAKPVQRDAFGLRAVAGQDVDILDRNVELVAAGIFERNAIVRRLLHGDLGQALVAADAMVGMDDEVAGGERGELGEEGVGALALLAAADEAVAEHVLLGEHGDLTAGEAVIELDDGEGDALCAKGLLPA